MIEKLVRKGVAEIPRYAPGRSREEVAMEYGLKLDRVVKLASNENPFGPPPEAIEEIRKHADKVNLYPDAETALLRRELSRYLALEPENIVVGNGSDEVMELAVKAFLEEGDEAIMPTPTFSLYASLVKLYSGKAVRYPLGKDFEYDVDSLLRRITSRTKLVFLCSPNNPTGSVIATPDLKRVLEKEVLVILDEAYVEFAGESKVALVKQYENLLVLRTFSKAFGLAGLRIGYGVACSKIIDYLMRVKPPFNVSLLAQRAALGALRDKKHLEQTIAGTLAGREFLAEELSKVPGVRVFPSQANFLLVEVNHGISAAEIAKELFRRGIIVRSCESFGLGDRYLRVSVGREEENKRFLEAFRSLLSHRIHKK
jgi:histidinol-phosphate aminotransferase